MNPQDLFKKSPQVPAKKSRKIYTCGSNLDDQPLIYGLKQNKAEIKFGNDLQRFNWITNGSVDVAFISAIDFARLKGGWKVIPDICKSVHSQSFRSNLFFNKNLGEIRSVAIHPNSRTSEIVLKILFKERYQIECEFVESSQSLQETLKKNDAFLLTGDISVEEAIKNPSFINIGEEWNDMTGLPLVYGFWLVNELTSQKEDYWLLQDSLKQGKNAIENILEGIKDKKDKAYKMNFLSNIINYEFRDEEMLGLESLYNYAFFYGLIEYIPDFNFAEK